MSRIADAWAERTQSPTWNTGLAAAKVLAAAGFSYWGITQKFPKLGAVAGVSLSCVEIFSLDSGGRKIESAHKNNRIGKTGILSLIRGIQLGTLSALATFFVSAVPYRGWKVAGGVVGLGVVVGSFVPTLTAADEAGVGDLPTAGYMLRLWTKRDQDNSAENRSLNGIRGALTGQTDYPLYNAIWAATKLTAGAMLTWVAARQYPAIGITAGALLSLAAEFVASHGVDSSDYLRKPEETSKIAQAGLLPFIRGVQLATLAALLKTIGTTIPGSAWKVAGCTLGLTAAAPIIRGGILGRNPERSDWEQTGIFFRVWNPEACWRKSTLITSTAKLALGGCLTWMGIQKFPGWVTTAGVMISLTEFLEAGRHNLSDEDWQDQGDQKMWLGRLGLLPFIRGVQLATTAALLKTIVLTVPPGAWKVIGTLVGPVVAIAVAKSAFEQINSKSEAAGVALRIWDPKAESRKSLCCLETLKLIGSMVVGYWAIKHYPPIGLGLSVFLSGAELLDFMSADVPYFYFKKAHRDSMLGAVGGLSLIRGLQLAMLAHLPLTLYRNMPLGFWIAAGSVTAAVLPTLPLTGVVRHVVDKYPPKGYSKLEKLGVILRVWNSSSHECIAPNEEKQSDESANDEAMVVPAAQVHDASDEYSDVD